MAHIYEKGQLVIPKYFRNLLGWEKNTEVKFEVQGNKLIVQKQKSIAQELEEFAFEVNVDLGAKTDFDNEIEDDTRKKYKKMGIEY